MMKINFLLFSRHSFAFPEGPSPAEGDVSDSSEANTADEEFSVREVDSKPRLAVAGKIKFRKFLVIFIFCNFEILQDPTELESTHS